MRDLCCPADRLPIPHPGRAPRPGRRRLWALGWTGALLLSLARAASPPGAGPGEQRVEVHELKAVYLYNFLQFVQWPESPRRLAPADDPLVIGVVGDTPLNRSLDALQASLGRSGRRAIRVTHFGPYREGLDLASCDLLFLAASEQGHVDRILAALGAAPVLTVADTERFLESGGMIALTEDRGKLRWMINRRAADAAGLRFNAQMLRLALKVLE